MCSHTSCFSVFPSLQRLFLTHVLQYTSHIASSCNVVGFQCLCSPRNEGAVNMRLVIKNQRGENESFLFYFLKGVASRYLSCNLLLASSHFGLYQQVSCNYHWKQDVKSARGLFCFCLPFLSPWLHNKPVCCSNFLPLVWNIGSEVTVASSCPAPQRPMFLFQPFMSQPDTLGPNVPSVSHCHLLSCCPAVSLLPLNSRLIHLFHARRRFYLLVFHSLKTLHTFSPAVITLSLRNSDFMLGKRLVTDAALRFQAPFSFAAWWKPSEWRCYLFALC